MFSFNDYDHLINHLQGLQAGAQVCKKVETPDVYQIELQKSDSFGGYELKAKRVGQGVALAVQNAKDGYYKEFSFPHGDPDHIHWESQGNRLILTVPKLKHPHHLLNRLAEDKQVDAAQSEKMKYLEQGGDPKLWKEAENMAKAVGLAQDIEEEDEAYENQQYMQPLNDMVHAYGAAKKIQKEDIHYLNNKYKNVPKDSLNSGNLDNLLSKAYSIVDQLDTQKRLSESDKRAKAISVAEQLADLGSFANGERKVNAVKKHDEKEAKENRKYMKPLEDMATVDKVSHEIEAEDERYSKEKKQWKKAHNPKLEEVADEEFMYKRSL